MYDNKVRLSQDVLEKASLIASEWGLKNARAAVEAVFRRYADEYLDGPRRSTQLGGSEHTFAMTAPPHTAEVVYPGRCEALSELDNLLGL